MDQIANLVIDLSIDSAEFRNEVPRIKKLLNDAAGDSERSAARMQRFLDKQTEATRRTSARTVSPLCEYFCRAGGLFPYGAGGLAEG
ncbi:hypothetical protein K9Y71_004030 [Salmonella enterica]|nr:hypothetical protein [Salmonella enterica]